MNESSFIYAIVLFHRPEDHPSPRTKLGPAPRSQTPRDAANAPLLSNCRHPLSRIHLRLRPERSCLPLRHGNRGPRLERRPRLRQRSDGGQSLDPEQYASFFTVGGGGGLTVHIVNVGPAAIALDLRGSDSGGNQSLGSFFGGVQLAYNRRPFGLRPYIQYSYGLFGTTAVAADPYVDTNICFFCTPNYVLKTSTRSANYRGYEVFAGVDYRLARFVDFRAVELGVGTGHSTNSSIGTAITNPTLFNIDTGLVVHF